MFRGCARSCEGRSHGFMRCEWPLNWLFVKDLLEDLHEKSAQDRY